MSNIPGWVWQLIGAVGGLALGLLLGAWHLKRKPAKRRPAQRPAAPGSQSAYSEQAGPASTLTGTASMMPPNSQLPGRADSPQQRLLERLRETNLDLSAQLRASAAQHSRLLKDKETEVSALKEDYDQRVEELRQSHSSELKHLMTLLVEQVDGIHKAHANHVRALEAEIDRVRGAARRHPAAGTAEHGEDADTTTFATTEVMSVSRRPH